MSENEKVLWWTTRYGVRHPVSVTGDARGWPHEDDEGQKMYVNSHFLTEHEAWNSLLRNAEAGVSLSTSEYRTAQERLAEATQRLADVAAALIETKREYEEWNRRAALSTSTPEGGAE